MQASITDWWQSTSAMMYTVQGEVVDGPTIRRSSSIAPSTVMPGIAPRSPIIWLKPFHTLRPSPVGRSKKFWVMPMQKTTRNGSWVVCDMGAIP
ncbi:hypothetical protein D3C76_1585730 [compost metagenome]